MCGVHGQLGAGAAATVRRMVDACRHRGPDGDGVWHNERIALGHNLLAIRADIASSRQPIHSSAGALSYNGEIYSGLPGDGSDTVRLGEALAAGGATSLPALDGMYALAWHAPDGSTLLARDRIGAKPLYYAEIAGHLTFSSELRGLLAAGVRPRLDPLGLHLYLELGYIPGPQTLIDGVRKLVPGECRRYGAAGGLEAAWNIAAPCQPTEFDPQTYRDKLVESVRRCLVSVRPFGLYLSGGLDSSSILWAMRELGVTAETLSMRFVRADKVKDEDCDVAAEVAATYGASHAEIPLSEDSYLAGLSDAFEAIDEPVASKGMPAYLVAHRWARYRGWVVVFTGDGGDELLGGYPYHENLRTDAGTGVPKKGDDPVSLWCRLHSRGDLREISGRSQGDLSLESYMRSWLPNIVTGDTVRDQLELEGLGHLAEEFLIRNDKLGMSQGLECRMPLLHEPFRSYAMGLPGPEKLASGLKSHTRLAMAGKLPESVLRKPKTGWGPPLGVWLEGKLRYGGPIGQRIRDVLQPGRVPALDPYGKIDNIWRKVKLVLRLFFLATWAERIGLEP